MIKLEGIGKVYTPNKAETIHALKNVNLNIQKGEMIAVMGPSGSGKTTLLNILGCLDSATSGTYLLDDKRIFSLNNRELAHVRNTTIGFVLQNFGLLSDRTVYENIVVPLLFSDCPFHGIKKRAASIMEALEIGGLANRRINQLSGGQKQRVALARAMINDPDILLADEPTGSLDSRLLDEVMRLFRTLNEKGKTVVIVTHNLDVGTRCDKIYALKDGILTAS